MAIDVKAKVTADPPSLVLQPPDSKKDLGPAGRIELILRARGSVGPARVQVRCHLDDGDPFVFRTAARRRKVAWKMPVDLGTSFQDVGKEFLLEKHPTKTPTPAILRIRITIQEINDQGAPTGPVVPRSKTVDVQGG